MTNTPRTVDSAVGNLWGTVDSLATRATWYADPDATVRRQTPDLLLVDEADRLKTASLEQLRDFYDRRHVGMVLIGMPGLHKRLARYAHLYSRVGFVHQFRALSGQELQGVIEHQWVQLELDTSLDNQADIAVFNAIARFTGGNFRLVQRLFAQIERRLLARRRRDRHAGTAAAAQLVELPHRGLCRSAWGDAVLLGRG